MPTWAPKQSTKVSLHRWVPGAPLRTQAVRRAPHGTNREDSRAPGQGRAGQAGQQRDQGPKAAGPFPGSRHLGAPESQGRSAGVQDLHGSHQAQQCGLQVGRSLEGLIIRLRRLCPIQSIYQAPSTTLPLLKATPSSPELSGPSHVLPSVPLSKATPNINQNPPDPAPQFKVSPKTVPEYSGPAMSPLFCLSLLPSQPLSLMALAPAPKARPTLPKNLRSHPVPPSCHWPRPSRL